MRYIEIIETRMQTYRFAFPTYDGNHPTAVAVTANTTKTAVIMAMRRVGSAIFGSTIFRGTNWEKMGTIRVDWPGPILYGFGADVVEVNMFPGKDPYTHARYTTQNLHKIH